MQIYLVNILFNFYLNLFGRLKNMYYISTIKLLKRYTMNELQQLINTYFTKYNQLEGTRYFKHKIVMSVSRDLNGIWSKTKTSLKEIWKELKDYFYKLENPQHTVRELTTSTRYYGDGKYLGD